jgi:hypothetical protein
MRVAPLALLLTACGGEEESDLSSRTWTAADFIPTQYTVLEYVPPGRGEATPLWLTVTATKWLMATGIDYAEAVETASWTAVADKTLTVADVEVLPKRFRVGDTTEDIEVLSLDVRETWYGVFDVALTVDISSGPLQGEAAFAEGIGPIFLTMGASTWDLASYALPTEDAQTE